METFMTVLMIILLILQIISLMILIPVVLYLSRIISALQDMGDFIETIMIRKIKQPKPDSGLIDL
jgi:hypothetical protein